MKTFLVAILLVLSVMNLSAQSKDSIKIEKKDTLAKQVSLVKLDSVKKDTVIKRVFPKCLLGANISQMAFSDWTQGGEDAFTFALIAQLGIDYRNDEWNLANNFKVIYGQTKVGIKKFKTNDNDMYLETVVAKKFGWEVDPYFSNTIRTTPAAGFKYANSAQASDTVVVDFFDPGYLTQSLGFKYSKIAALKTRLGVASQETFSSKYRTVTDDPKTAGIESYKFETGIESVTDIDYEFLEKTFYKSQLRFFSRFNRIEVWDVRWDSSIIAQVNKFIAVNFNVLLVYDQVQSTRTQIKEALQLGLAFNVF